MVSFFFHLFLPRFLLITWNICGALFRRFCGRSDLWKDRRADSVLHAYTWRRQISILCVRFIQLHHTSAMRHMVSPVECGSNQGEQQEARERQLLVARTMPIQPTLWPYRSLSVIPVVVRDVVVHEGHGHERLAVVLMGSFSVPVGALTVIWLCRFAQSSGRSSSTVSMSSWFSKASTGSRSGALSESRPTVWPSVWRPAKSRWCWKTLRLTTLGCVSL